MEINMASILNLYLIRAQSAERFGFKGLFICDHLAGRTEELARSLGHPSSTCASDTIHMLGNTCDSGRISLPINRSQNGCNSWRPVES